MAVQRNTESQTTPAAVSPSFGRSLNRNRVVLSMTLLAIAGYGLYRLYAEKASFSWFLLSLYVLVAGPWLLVSFIMATQWLNRDNRSQHLQRKFNFRATLASVSGISALYCVAAVVICIFALSRPGLAIFYALPLAACLAFLAYGVIRNRKSKNASAVA